MHDGMRGLIPWFATNPVAANLLMLLVICLGVIQMGHLRKEAFPSLEPDSLTVSVSYDSGSARQSEEGLAIKIEDQLEDVLGIKSLESSSSRSGVNVTIEKQSGYDLDVLLRDVKAKIDAISTFPAEAKKAVIEKAERKEHALWLQVYGDTDRRTLQQLADELKRDLLADPYISRVAVSGWLDPMISVEIDEYRLQAHGLSLSDVQNAMNQESSNTATAVLRNDSTSLQIKASEQAYEITEFADITLRANADGSRVLLGDVASVRDDFADDTSVLSRFNGHDSIALQVITTGQDDIADSVRGAREVVQRWIENGRLPKGVELSTWYDRSTMISERLELLSSNALCGFGLVFLMLALFLNLTVAFWVAMGLPFIFFGTLYFMGDGIIGAGLSLNEFTTFGFIMALGIVVDDAIVIGESIYSTRARQGDSVESTIRGTMQVALPTLFGVLTTVAAFFAISQTSGHMGQLYAQFATVVSICLLLSVVESKLILPAHLAHLNTRRLRSENAVLRSWQYIQAGTGNALEWVNQRCYRPLIDLALCHRYAVLILFCTMFVLVAAMPFTGALRISFFPDVPGDIVRADIVMTTDSSYGQTHAALNLLAATAQAADLELRRAEDESAIAVLQILSEEDQSGSVKVELIRDAPYDINTFTRKWQQLAGLPAGTRSLSIRNAPVMADALRIELLADDEDVLATAGTQFRERLREYPAVSGIEDNLDPNQPQVFLQLTPQGRALGLTTDMLAQQVFQALSGQLVQRFQRGSDEIEVKVRYPGIHRQSVNDVLNVRIRTADGQVLPLSSVATAQFGYTRDTIRRIDGKRAIFISADVDKDMQSSTELVTQLRHQLVPQLTSQYPGLSIHFGGEAEEQAETQNSMLHMFLLALLVIYFLLAVPLKSYVQPVLIMTAIPFGIVGAMLGHWFNDLALGILSLNGIIALSGVCVNDSLLLVSTFNDMDDKSLSLHDRLVEAGSRRLRAVLLTSFTTAAGLLPLLRETSMQAQFLIPAAVSLAYGILFATGITLVLVPVLLMIQHDVTSLVSGLWRSIHSADKGTVTC
jgi:multidrug efflux pump subunit AcrB